MAKVVLIGVEPPELQWLRALIALLRHPDPSVPELARQALVYLTEAAARHNQERGDRLDPSG